MLWGLPSARSPACWANSAMRMKPLRKAAPRDRRIAERTCPSPRVRDVYKLEHISGRAQDPTLSSRCQRGATETAFSFSFVAMGTAARPDLHDPASLAALGHVEIVARWIV